MECSTNCDCGVVDHDIFEEQDPGVCLKDCNLKDSNWDSVSIITLDEEEKLAQDRQREIDELRALGKKVRNLHTKVLFYRTQRGDKKWEACLEAYKVLVLRVGGTQNLWKELGASLGIPRQELDYIENAMPQDAFDTVLRVFMQEKNATLDKIINLLVERQRYDILRDCSQPFENLSQAFRNLNNTDSGFQSGNQGMRQCIEPNIVTDELPAPLRKRFDRDPPQPNFMRPPLSESISENSSDSPTLFLTFVEDGHRTANVIKMEVESWTQFPGIKVITLSDNREEIFQNPEKSIRKYFEKAAFIVPIITSGYLDEIKSHNSSVPNTTDNLDYKYVPFIYNLIINNYIHASGCLNKKVRSVLPKNVNVDVLRKVALYPDLAPFTYETKFEPQFKAFLKVLLEPKNN